MAFGQQAGPPASATQVKELLALLQAAGHGGFRQARGPMGFTQRQGSGKFTRDEAGELIARLQDAEFQGESASGPPVERAPRLSGTEALLRRVPDEEMAAELRRRGWTVGRPD